MTVRSKQPWYWQWFVALLLILFGYLAGYWQFTGGDYIGLIQSVNSLLRDNQQLEARTVYRERQLQVERAAQQSLADELAALQDENMELKGEVAFYRGILNESSATGELKLHSFKINKGKLPDQYEYHVLLIQSGRHDRAVQGDLKFGLVALQNGEEVSLPLMDGIVAIAPVKVNFKYYQRIDGSFVLPPDVSKPSVTLALTEKGQKEPKIRQKLDLPK
jgi:cell division protein FtsB